MKMQALALSSLCAAALTATSATWAQDTTLETEDDKVNYGLGMMIGESLKQFGDVDYDMLLEGIKAQHQDAETALTLEEVRGILQEKQARDAEEKSAMAKEKSETYLTDNAAREQVTVTDSGLQYEVLQPADGAKPTADDTVTVHYVGTLLDGTEFDSSIARGEPASFPLKGVIPGWTEGLQLMNVGSKFRFVIPSDLAYGDRGAGQNIGPGETLIFEVELLEIK